MRSLMHHDVYMRTTLTLDDDLGSQLNDLAHRQRKPFRTVVNDALRRGLGAPGAAEVKPFKVTPFALELLPGLDDRRFNQLFDELEAERAAEKLKQRS